MHDPAIPAPKHGPGPGLPVGRTDLRVAGPRILVVEDEAVIALLIEDIVSELAYEVAAIVPRLDAAMELLDSEIFDIAVLDVYLSGKTVFPFAAELQAREIPFLFATAYGAHDIPEEFRGRLVLKKPFGPLELHRALLKISGTG